MTSPQPYTRAEIEALGDQLPERGAFCPSCGLYIPEFADISAEELTELKQNDTLTIFKTLREKTGCNLKWAKIWSQHPDGPHPLVAEETAPCPYCGVPLHPGAEQCLLCRMDWHDPTHPKQLGRSIADQILEAEPGTQIEVTSHSTWLLAQHFAELHHRRDEITIHFAKSEKA
ncbi:hypothetical protein Enr10x_20670 [Gimesia panareensis]|uniref:Double zinc ribbon n=1 Tax=Gimesia panareensis TaxID=2527978 RepID=A0A517Q575_9PLAN|nr:hypothetical protein [Gimesia panareensis]QDT26757.1 hypothetical protein Enr10x_20670 [Gimesia panareensis]